MDLRGIDLNLLLVFDAVARTGSVTAASRAVGTSQPATSAALARLRAHLGDPLFVRRGARMEPTARARALAPAVRRALGDLGAALGDRGFDPRTASRVFSVWCGDALGLVAVPALTAAVSRDAPGVAVHVAFGRRGEALDELARGDVDLVLDAFTEAPARCRLRALGAERFVTVVRRDSAALSPDERAAATAGTRAPMSLDTFVAFAHVLHSVDRGARGMVDDALAAQGLARRVAAVVPHFLTIPAIVAAGDLCATLPERVARRVAAQHGLAVFDPPVPLPTLTLSMVWHERTDGAPAHAWFRERVAAVGVEGDAA